jgi:hypothetical protein
LRRWLMQGRANTRGIEFSGGSRLLGSSQVSNFARHGRKVSSGLGPAIQT